MLRISGLWLRGPFRGCNQSKLAGMEATGENTHMKIHTHVHTHASSSKTVAKGPTLTSSVLSLFSHNDVRFTILVNLLTFNTRKAFQGHIRLYSVI